MSILRSLAAILMTIAALALAVPAAAQFTDRYTFFKAVKDADVLKAKSLLDQPGSSLVNMRDPESGEMALHLVTRRRDSGWMGFLIGHGADVNARDVGGNTPLIVAAQLGFLDGIQLLVKQRGNVNAVNSRGESALIFAVQLRNLQAVRELLAAGANPDLTDNVAGLSARDYAANDRRAAGILRLIRERDDVKPADKPES